MSQEQVTGFQVGANINPFEVAMRRMVDSAGSAQSQLSGVFGKMNGALAAAATALAGGAMLKKSIEATQQFTGEANKLARVLGTTATEASTLNVALGDIYTDADVFTGAAGKLAKELRTNEAALQGMGLQTRDAAGNLRPLKDLMIDSITVVNSYKQGIDRNIAAQQMWGKGAEEASSLLKLNNEVLDAAAQKQQALGLVVGQENVEASRSYKAAMNDVGDVLLAINKAIGDAVMPILTKLGEWFATIGPAAVVIIKGAIGGLAAVFWGLKNAVVIVWETINAMVVNVIEPIRALSAAITKAVTGDWQGAKAELAGINKVISGAWSQAMNEMVKSSEETTDKIRNLFAQPTSATKKAEGGKSAAGLTQSDSQLGKWDAELNALKQANADKNAAEGTYYEFSKAQELAFWNDKKAIVNAGSKDAFGVQAKITAATLDVQKAAFETRLAELHREQSEAEQNYNLKADLSRREMELVVQRYGTESRAAQDAQRKIQDIERAARDQRRQLREIELSEIAGAATQRVELERQRLQFEFDAGWISRSQLLAADQEFEQQKFSIQSAALAQRLAMVDPELNPVEYARIKNEILQLEQQHQLKKREIRSQAMLEESKDLRNIADSIGQGFAQVANTLLTNWKGMGAALRSVLANIGQSIIQEIVIKPLQARIAAWAKERLMTMAGIGADAAKAGSGAAASQAGIPFVGPVLAIAAMAAMFLAVGNMAGKVPSASRGFDIPAGLNPLTQLHEQEMVLPAEHANVIRDLANDGGRSAGGGESSIQIYARNDDDVVRAGDLKKLLTQMKRDFVFIDRW